MKKTVFASLALALVSPLFAGGEGWLIDFEAAKKKAEAENKDLLVDFTGSDWCGWCIKLVDEVFKHEPFKAGVADKFVLVELDFPKDKSKMSAETIAQNKDLQKKYQIKGFPTILLLDSKGRPFAQTGYQAGGPEKYVAHLDELQAQRKTRDEALTAADKLEGVPKAEALVKALSGISPTLYAHYDGIVKQIAALDPKDTTGFTSKQKRIASQQELEGNVTAAMKAGNTNEAISTIDGFIKQYDIKGEEAQRYLGMKIQPLLMAANFDGAGKAIDELIAAAPESDAAKYAERFKPRLAKMKEEAAKKAEAQPEPKTEKKKDSE